MNPSQSTSKSATLLFPHQLFAHLLDEHDIYSLNRPVYLVEEQLFFKEFNFHKTKIAYHRASMQAHAKQLRQLGVDLHYIDSQNALSDIRELVHELKQQGIEQLHFINPTDNWLEKRLHQAITDSQLDFIEYENPLFINTRNDLSSFFKTDKKSYFQTTFYKQQRVKLDILMEQDGKTPVGGQWTYDIDNRKKYPRGQQPPNINYPVANSDWDEAITYVNEHFTDNLGERSHRPPYPYNRPQALDWLEQFLDYRFHHFGDYEDAILAEESTLHHSLLTPMLNVGLLSPQEVIDRALTFAQANDVPINSTEGFIRQIIGWREFIRGMYECRGSEARTSNFWGFSRPIPPSFYDGTTGITPVDDTIRKVLRDGYCHHIERLMILGNFMLLCEFDPDEVYRWFMELFIDAYDWVMVPNVYGMSQFADGGLFATKPYISGSNYILKMSDYKKGYWQAAWDGLFWSFMSRHRDFFLSNPRLGMLVHTFNKMDESKQQLHLDNAEQFIESLYE